jgi:hypothetical protein
MSAMVANKSRLGEILFAKAPKVNAELFSLTYGALVMQIIRDIDEIEEINKKLDKLGHNIGVRIIDEFLAKSGTTSCSNFRETAETLSKVAFKMFLGINTEVTGWNSDDTAFTLVLAENPLISFVELPAAFNGLNYSSILCGVMKGALEMVQLQVDCTFTKDVLKGDESNEIRVVLKRVLGNTMLEEYNMD